MQCTLRKFIPAVGAAISLGFGFWNVCPEAAGAPEKGTPPNYPSTLGGGAPCGSCVAPANISWKTVVTDAGEPGEPMVISGTIYEADGKTPAKDIGLYIYHTDVTGYYNKNDDPSHPRLHGWMKTGADGRYEFRTIRPGAYPHRNEPSHIHVHVYGENLSERSIDSYWFADDPRVNDSAREKARKQGETPFEVILKRDSEGVWRGTRDITLKRDAKE